MEQSFSSHFNKVYKVQRRRKPVRSVSKKDLKTNQDIDLTSNRSKGKSVGPGLGVPVYYDKLT